MENICISHEQKEIKSLKEMLKSMHDHQATPPLTDHLEIAQKELAAHKEMVAELRNQLAEKETEFQVCV